MGRSVASLHVGWPWPEESYGLGPMFGDEGWCRGCGTALNEQTGHLVMQGRGFPSAEVWMPNWLFDVVCVSAQMAVTLRERFSVTLREVHKPRGGASGLMQLLPGVTHESWYRREDLSAAVTARHGQHDGDRTGATCPACGCWKWLPVAEGEVLVVAAALSETCDVIASPERFGDGLASSRHLLFRRALAETLAAATPRIWDIVEVRAG